MTSKRTPAQKKPSQPSRSASREPAGDLTSKAVPWNPEPYQIEAVSFLLDHACAGLFLPPGLRKTSCTLGAIKLLKREGILDKVLIIAPLRVCYSVWPKEVAKWKDFEHLRVEILHGDKKDEALKRDADIYLINPEGIPWLLGAQKVKMMWKNKRKIEYDQELVGKPGIVVKSQWKYDLKKFKALGVDTLVMDEISKFKHANNDRFAHLKQMLNLFDRRWGLTGSPAPNGLLDLFGVMYAIDGGRSLGQYITHYRNAYFMQSGWGGFEWVPQVGAEERIYERIAPVTFRLDAEDYLTLPKLVENIVQVELPPEARRIYDELEDEFISELLDGTTVVAANAGAASVKCRQVANGGLFLQQEVDEDGRKKGKREWRDIHTTKVEATRDLVEELNGAPAIITYDFEHDLARLLKEFGEKSAVIGGGVSAKKSDAIVEQWNSGKLPWLFGHPAAMGHGLNMQDGNAQHIILHSLTYDFELYDQLIRRLLRSGNAASHVFVHFVVAKNTVDEAIVMALRKKEKTQSALLNALREYSKQRQAEKRAAAKKKR